jgi:hypothetical protein
MGVLTDVVRTWAQENITEPEVTVKDEGNRATLKYTASGDKEEFIYTAFFEVNESSDLLGFFLYAPVKAPVGRRAAVADALARINRGYRMGHIDLDMEDGELRYRTAIDVEDGTLSPTMLQNIHNTGIDVLDRALPILMAIAYANAAPATAIEQASSEKTELPEPVTAEASPWERIAGAQFLKDWAGELKAARESKGADDWRLTGPAVVLVSEDLSHCRSALPRVAAEAGFRYVLIEDEDVPEMPSLAAFSRLAPVLLHLEPGRWCLGPQEDESADLTREVDGFQRRLAKWIGVFDPAKPVLVVTSQKALGEMSNLLDGPGRFDRYLTLPPQSMEARGESFLDDLGRERCGESVLKASGKLGKLISGCPSSPTWRTLARLYLQRLHRRSGRPIEFLDLMHLATRGFAELGPQDLTGDSTERRQVAVHEAGHAAVAILDSGGLNIPDYCSIVPSADFRGVVAESVAYHYARKDRFTYLDLRHQVRISLAGRAAEEVVFGPELVSGGASGDLETCYRHASKAFYTLGFAPNMGAPGMSASNLAILVGTPSPSEFAHNEHLVRQFLATEYAQTLNLLQTNRPLLDAITDRLMWDPIVDQEELKALLAENNTLSVASATQAATFNESTGN